MPLAETIRTVAEFLERSEALLLEHETEHNLVLGLANNIASGATPADQALFFTVTDAGTVGFAITTNPQRPLVLSRMSAEAAKILARFVFDRNIPIGGVVGPVEASEPFAAVWEAATGRTAQLSMHLGLFQLDQIIFPEPDGGRLVPVSEISNDLALRYVQGFLQDVDPHDKELYRTAQESVARHRRNGTLFFWQIGDQTPVSMAGKVRETRNGATIALVYTPPELRGRGYASRITAALSALQLKNGKKFCNLFTDLSNPTSNSIYQKIGYRRVGESKHFRFE